MKEMKFKLANIALMYCFLRLVMFDSCQDEKVITYWDQD